ncbi:MAG: transglutaminase-like cysteine peptidase [Parvibaculaceae bacterium]
MLNVQTLSVTPLPQLASTLQRHEAAIGTLSGARVWDEAVTALAAIPTGRLLEAVNATVNQNRYIPDRGDYWAAPLELFAAGGDCEDFAIAKYLILRALGLPSGSMRVVVLFASPQVPEHAVLVVATSNGAWVLDNLEATPYQYSPAVAGRMAYAFNETGMWVGLGSRR